MRILRQKKYWLEHAFEKKYQDIRDKVLGAFKDLVFVEDGHKYFVGDRELQSVSVVTHYFKPEFDTETKAQETFERNFNNPDSKYYKMTPDEIKASWKKTSADACAHGTERHEFAESCFYFMLGQYDKILPEFKDRIITDDDGYGFVAQQPKEEAVVKVYEDFPDFMIPILAETKVYNIQKDYAYSGTFDILFYLENPNGPSGLYVLDWKTNKDIYKHFGDSKLLPPFDDCDDTSFEIYKLQLSAYQMALEEIGLSVIRRELFWLRPNGSYEKLILDSRVSRLKHALAERKIK